VWLVGGGDTNLHHLSSLALHALGTADAMIHDPGIAQEILDLVQPPRYREVASPEQAIKRVIKLAEDCWRVVQFVTGGAMERAAESAIRCAEREIPFCIVPGAGEPIGSEAPLGLLLVRKTLSFRSAEPGPTLVLLVATSQSDSAVGIARRRHPLDFSMPGLAG